MEITDSQVINFLCATIGALTVLCFLWLSTAIYLLRQVHTLRLAARQIEAQKPKDSNLSQGSLLYSSQGIPSTSELGTNKGT